MHLDVFRLLLGWGWRERTSGKTCLCVYSFPSKTQASKEVGGHVDTDQRTYKQDSTNILNYLFSGEPSHFSVHFHSIFMPIFHLLPSYVGFISVLPIPRSSSDVAGPHLVAWLSGSGWLDDMLPRSWNSLPGEPLQGCTGVDGASSKRDGPQRETGWCWVWLLS